MKKNYQAWQTDISHFNRESGAINKLRFLLNFAILAPSSHNSQPWQFEITPNSISILPDFRRALSYSDNNHRQLYISLGCAIENILVAADYYGFQTSNQYISEEKGLSITLMFEKKPVSINDPNHLIFAIPKRHTNRSKYLNRMPEEHFLDRIKNFSTNEHQISLIEESPTKRQIAGIVSNALVQTMNDTMFRKELSTYVKSNITASFIGMPAFGFGIPTPISLIAPVLLKYINMNKLTKKQDLELLTQHTPMFCVIATQEDNSKAWIESGRLYQKIALHGQKNGLATAPMAAAIQIREFYKELQKILNTRLRPQVFFRLGYPSQIMHHSPRFNLSQREYSSNL